MHHSRAHSTKCREKLPLELRSGGYMDSLSRDNDRETTAPEAGRHRLGRSLKPDDDCQMETEEHSNDI